MTVPLGTCELCTEFADPRTAPFGVNRTIYRSADTVAMPTLGCFRAGYILVCPITHVTSTAQLGAPGFRRFITDLRHLRTTVEATYGPSVVFEHGMRTHDQRAGGCVDHAHMHLLPANDAVAMSLAAALEGGERSMLSELRSWRDEAYLMASGLASESIQVIRSPRVRSQHLRRISAGALGLSDRYDWGLFPQAETMTATVETLRPRLLIAEEGDR